MDVKDRIRGAFTGMVFGAAVNQRFGPMLAPEEARKRFGDKPFSETPKDYTLYDEYTKSKINYDILLKHGKITPEIQKEYLLDLHKRANIFNDFIYGPSTQRAVKAILQGDDIYTMGRTGITCGGAFSALPIGIFFFKNRKQLIENTAASCVLSHNTDVAIDAAIALNVTLAALLNRKEKFAAIDEGIRAAKENHGRFGARTSEPLISARIRIAVQLVKGKTMEHATRIIPKKIGVGWFAREAIPAAFADYAVADNPQDACLLAIRWGGSIDSVSEIACTFLGAEQGPGIFPKDILRKIEKKNKVDIDRLILKLFEKMAL